MGADAPLRLTGRPGSHFTRVAVMFAEELGVRLALEYASDLTSLEPEGFGGHPALKIPTLHLPEGDVWGTENVCRALARIAGRAGDPTVVLPEHVEGRVARNAQELAWHSMSAQVLLVVGLGFGRLPADNVLFRKSAAGMRGALAWLDAHLDEALAELPSPRLVSVLELALFCLMRHFDLRPTVPLDPLPRLTAWAEAFGQRPSAARTPFRAGGFVDHAWPEERS